ncbi:MAG TPA: alpha/beta fold hydrolase [Anaerolineaceae bacterium]|nr:alpha/beta fold hydrolase [Anaerolineaceae bacterium]
MSSNLTMQSAEPFFIPGGKIGCLLIHGFTGTPKEMRMLGDSLADSGYTVLAPRLFGHATQPDDIRRARWQDWLASVEDGINLLKGCTDQQFIMGLSMGGVLSLVSAARYVLAGAVAFSTPSSLPDDPRSVLLPLIGWLNLHVGKGKPDWRNREAAADHVDYPYYSTHAILELNKLINVMQSELQNVKMPVLLVQSRSDTTIPADSMDSLFQRIASSDKSKLWVENSGHVVIREPEREKIFTEVKSFLKRLQG